jgi:AraC-like DNA-binding protein
VGPAATTRFSTSEAPAGGELAHWREMIDATFVPLRVTPLGADEEFEGSVVLRSIGELQVARVHARPMAALHSSRHVRLSSDDDYLLAVHLAGVARATQDGRRVTLRTGDIALFDSSRPYEFAFHAARAFSHLIFRIPRPALDARGAALGEATAVRVPADSDEGRLVFGYLRTLSAVAMPPAARSTHALSAAALDLIAAALGSVAGAPRASRHATRSPLERAKQETLARLADPSLAPADVAAASFVSVRQLHRLFAAEGATFGGFLRESRLRRCREDLADPRLARRPIAEIAAHHGCRSAPHFTRMFAARYSVTPRAFRAAALAGAASDR